jgi:hypothetical protein
MISGYYILPKQVFLDAASEEPFAACAHQIDDKLVICWARFADHGHEARFRSRPGVEPLPDARKNQSISEVHAVKLSHLAVKPGHTAMDVSDALEEKVGSCMKLPS